MKDFTLTDLPTVYWKVNFPNNDPSLYAVNQNQPLLTNEQLMAIYEEMGIEITIIWK